jgi:hypothetical protein
MPDFGIFRGFSENSFGDKLYAGQLPKQLGAVGSNSLDFLLDIYPNAAAAYSLRKLRTAYTGNVIRVRRASDNTEQDIGFSGENLDTLSLTSFCSGTNGFVTTWYDQSGNNRNMTQSTAANQPQIVSSGNVIIQGTKPIIQFNSANHILNTVSFALSVNRTYIMNLFNAINNTNGSKLYLGAVAGGADNLVNGIQGLSNFSNVASSYIGSGAANTRVGTGALPNNQYFLLGAYVQGSVQHHHYRNAVLNAENTSLTISPTTTSQVQSILRTPTTNDLRTSECIIYDSYQLSNRVGIEININDYYGIY